MKALFTLLILILVTSFAIAQQSSFPQGIYKSIESILSKKPSLKDSLKISKSSYLSSPNKNMFELKPYNKGINKKDIKKSYYGYSDGAKMYLNGYKFGIYYNYMPVIYEGKRFIVFMGIMSRYGSELYHIQKKLIPYLTVNDTSPRRSWGVNPVGFAFGGLIGGVLYSGPQKNIQFLYALDTETQELYTLSIETMQKLLSEQKKLLIGFNNIPNRHKYEVYLKYMKLLDSEY